MAGTAIGDELLEWPPDVFALTEVILQRSQAYRFALSPPAGLTWPPASFPDWPGAVAGAARRWSSWAEDRNQAIPGLLAQEWAVLRDRAGSPLNDLTQARDWRLCEALLTLHAIADEACAGLGVAALDASSADGLLYRARGRELLARTGSLARFPAHLIRVLPKVRTPTAGSSVRALSRNACVLGPGVEARWHKAPARDLGTQPSGERVNYLLLPWPLRIRASDFRPVRGPLQRLANDPFGFFEFAPSERLDLDLVDRMLATARDRAGAVDVVVLPESAVEDTEIEDLETLLDRHGVTGLITGIRERPAQPGQFPRNWVHIGVSTPAASGCISAKASTTGGPWMTPRSANTTWAARCIRTPAGGRRSRYRPRSVQFVEFGDGVTLASLVCEDLAQTDDVAHVIRSVGPMIVVTPLLDGPQLNFRWAARYASVLADDPGSAVLTLTSFGMAQRSALPGQNPSPVVALWKSPGQQTREISLEPGAQGILLSASIVPATRRSFDGRPPGATGRQFSDVSIQQVRAASTGTRSQHSPPGTPPRATLAPEELTILASWEQAAAEALAFAPERLAAVTADAQAGAPWRAELRIRQPSPPLQHSISGIFHAVYPGTVASSDPRALVATTGTEISHPGPRRPRAGTGVQPGRPVATTSDDSSARVRIVDGNRVIQ